MHARVYVHVSWLPLTPIRSRERLGTYSNVYGCIRRRSCTKMLKECDDTFRDQCTLLDLKELLITF